MYDFTAVRFENKKEYIELSDRIETFPVGNLLLSVIDIDWLTYIEEVEKTINLISFTRNSNDLTVEERMKNPKRSPYFIAARFNEWFNKQMKEDSPVLYYLFSSQAVLFYKKYFLDKFNVISLNKSVENNLLDTETNIKNFNIQYKSFKEPEKTADVFEMFFAEYPDYPSDYFGHAKISDMQLIELVNEYLNYVNKQLKSINNYKKDIETIFDNIFNSEDIPINERFQLLLLTKPDLFKNYFTDDYSIHFKNKTFSQGYSFAFYSSNICALAFLEFKYICMNNFEFKKCANCGKYFIPFSSLSLYCDRIANKRTKRSCKEIAAMSKYSDKINNDEAKKFYRQQANAYQMRCRRSPENYLHEDYEEWKERSKKLLNQFENGKISLTEFEEAVRIIDKK